MARLRVLAFGGLLVALLIAGPIAQAAPTGGAFGEPVNLSSLCVPNGVGHCGALQAEPALGVSPDGTQVVETDNESLGEALDAYRITFAPGAWRQPHPAWDGTPDTGNTIGNNECSCDTDVIVSPPDASGHRRTYVAVLSFLTHNTVITSDDYGQTWNPP